MWIMDFYTNYYVKFVKCQTFTVSFLEIKAPKFIHRKTHDIIYMKSIFVVIYSTKGKLKRL